MSEHKLLDAAADVLPVGLQPTPFGEVWQALQQVAAHVWDVDPSVYRAGIAWMWYALRNPDALAADGLRPLLVAALISEQAPLVKDTQTVAELAEYLRLWRDYTPTYAKLEAIFATFGARVEVRPISDAESQGVVPVADRRLAFYLRVEDFDAARPLTLDEVYQIAVRATPLGARPVPYFALVGSSDVFAGPASAGLVRALWASEPAAAPPMSFVVVDSATGAIVHGFNQALEVYELPSVSLPTPNVVIGVPITGPVQAFWFTDEGRDETNDKTFTAVGNPLFDEDGSVARNELYDSAVPLSFMQHDGNMFAADSDSDIVRYLPVTDRLVLSIPGDSTTCGKSAWSVQVAKLFVLSYANEQLPDVQIELPINEVGPYGTSITLPAIDGEYESGGKTWKPSAWDIGAFGSSYSLTGDVVAHLVFTEVVQYQEITLYLQSGSKRCQLSVSSSFTGDVDSERVYQLYTDEHLTTPWTGYDYSNDYEVGRYVGGEWNRYTDSVSAMPSSTAILGIGYILMDTGALWLCCNARSSTSVTITNIVVRIYPKEQQYYSLYGGASRSVYNNVTISNGGHRDLYGIPNRGSNALIVPWGGSDASLPTRTLQAVIGSAGNSVSGLSLYNGSNSFRIQNSSGASREFRTVVFTLSTPTIISYTNTTNTVVTVNSSTPVTLYDDNGNTIQYDANYAYIILGAFGVSGPFYGTFGAAVTSSWSDIQNLKLTANGSGNLQVEFVGSGTLSINKIWYTKTPKPIEVNFGDPVTIPAGYYVESVKCSRGYAFASNVSSESSIMGQFVHYELPGEKIYFDDTNTALVGVGVAPALQIFAIVTLEHSGYNISTKSGTSVNYLTSASASYLNSDGFFVKGSTTYNESAVMNSVASAMQTLPVCFNLSDSSGNWLYFCFNVPQTLWQFSGGVFSWLGNTASFLDLAYWYNGRAVQIILAKD